MKKVIFISAIALAAAVSCTKSEVVDTKFNEQIGFETYLGRDAQTKAAVATSITEAGIYGFYTAGDKWDATSTANLWVNNTLSSNGTVDEAKYWTNAEDHYTFLAYAPKGNANLTVTEGQKTNPVVTYTVAPELANQIDVLYAGAKDVQKKNVTDKVGLTFKHALARLTVNAKTAENQAFEFRVKKITISGGFITKDVLTLDGGVWAANGAPVAVTEETPATVYTFYNKAENATPLTTTATEYAKVGDVYNNYLMMIPTNFSGEGAAATLTVEYTTFYENTESTVNKVTFPVNTNFEKGKAYAINLTFTKDVQPIEFSVSVENWQPTTTTGEGDDATTTTDEIYNDQNIAA